MPKLLSWKETPSSTCRQWFPGRFFPAFSSHLSPDGLNGPPFDASGLSSWVWPMNTLLRTSAQWPVMTSEAL